jgi:hypothetical protein
VKAVLTHDGDRWVALCDECSRPLATAPWWAPERLTAKRTRHPPGGCAAALIDDLRTYVAGRETFHTAAARRGVTVNALTKTIRRATDAYPEHAPVLAILVQTLWANGTSETAFDAATQALKRRAA